MVGSSICLLLLLLLLSDIKIASVKMDKVINLKEKSRRDKWSDGPIRNGGGECCVRVHTRERERGKKAPLGQSSPLWACEREPRHLLFSFPLSV